MSNTTKKKKVVASKPVSSTDAKPLKKKKKRPKPTAQEKPAPKITEARYATLATELFALSRMATDIIKLDIRGQDVGLPRSSGYNKPIPTDVGDPLVALLESAVECGHLALMTVCEQWKKDYPNVTIPKKFTQIAERYTDSAVSG